VLTFSPWFSLMWCDWVHGWTDEWHIDMFDEQRIGRIVYLIEFIIKRMVMIDPNMVYSISQMILMGLMHAMDMVIGRDMPPSY
jgi:hypothetical protein